MLPLLGFAIRNNTGKMYVGLSATKPNKAWSRLNPTYKIPKFHYPSRIPFLTKYRSSHLSRPGSGVAVAEAFANISTAILL